MSGNRQKEEGKINRLIIEYIEAMFSVIKVHDRYKIKGGVVFTPASEKSILDAWIKLYYQELGIGEKGSSFLSC